MNPQNFLGFPSIGGCNFHVKVVNFPLEGGAGFLSRVSKVQIFRHNKCQLLNNLRSSLILAAKTWSLVPCNVTFTLETVIVVSTFIFICIEFLSLISL